MTLVLFLLVGLLLIAALVHLALSVNEFEEKVRNLEKIVQGRYQIDAPVKKKKKADDPNKIVSTIHIPALKAKP